MKKRNMLLLALLLALAPAAGSAQDLPELFEDVYESIGEGLAQGAGLAANSLGEELTLTLATDSARVEEGKSVVLTVTAGNPLAREVSVGMTLELPERLRASEETAWEATLPAAQLDEETGELTPSVTTFTRELTLLPGGGSEQAVIGSELEMGTRFYRAQTPLALCVPDVSVNASVEGAENHRMQPGDAFAYRIEIANAGDAPKDVAVEMVLPQDVTLTAQLPEGFAQAGSVIRGKVYAQAADGDEPSSAVITLPAVIAQNALEGDEDAHRLMAGTLRVDGERVPLERIEVCDAKINARLLADTERLEAGEETTLSVVVVNSGLAAADVRLSCMLPDGLSLAVAEDEQQEATAAEVQAAPMNGGGDDLPMTGTAVPGQLQATPVMTRHDRTLVFDLHMDAADEASDGVIACTRVIEIPVVADTPQDNLGEQLVGASLAWSVGEEQMQLGEAVAMRVVRPEFLGMSRADWNGVFWASVLLVVTVLCLYVAVRRESKEEDFCCE
ncbi:MAG: hypothetical protein J6M56_08005 [Clostridia bacterium]|nr:hypothetical protein [Clostridia bacterium]